MRARAAADRPTAGRREPRGSQALTIQALLAEAAARAPGRVRLTRPEGEITLGELRERAARVGGGLAGCGGRKEDRVGVLLPNSPAYFLTCFALGRLGAALVPISTAFTPPRSRPARR